MSDKNTSTVNYNVTFGLNTFLGSLADRGLLLLERLVVVAEGGYGGGGGGPMTDPERAALQAKIDDLTSRENALTERLKAVADAPPTA